MPDNKDIIDNLEKIEEESSIKFSSRKIDSIEKAKTYLDELENFSSSLNSAEIKQTKNKDSDNITNLFPYKMDIQLSEVVGKIFDTSHNFFIIVRDDKVLYANKSFLDVIDAEDAKAIYNEKFFKFIIKEDWNVLAKNIGEMLIENLSVNVRISSLNGRIIPVQFKAVYLPDNRHFTFILMGQRFYGKDEAHGLLYDNVTGLPNYYLFEDRLQVAVNLENYSKSESRKNIGVAVISIDNLQTFIQNGRQNVILRKMAEKLVFALNKRYTIAVGQKYQFWIMMPDIENEKALKEEARNIAEIFDDTVKDGTDELDTITSIGVSMFPTPSNSAYKLMDNAIRAVIKAKSEGGNKVVFAVDEQKNTI